MNIYKPKLTSLIMIIGLCVTLSSWAQSNDRLHTKPNDYLVAKLLNPQSGAANFKYAEMTEENTQFLSKDLYRTSSWVQKQFTKDGRFDEAEWDRFYELLSDEWFRFCYWGYKNCAELEVWKLNPDGSMPYRAPSDLKIIYCHGCTFWKIIR